MSPRSSSTVNSEIKSALGRVIIAVFVICAVCAGGDLGLEFLRTIPEKQEPTGPAQFVPAKGDAYWQNAKQAYVDPEELAQSLSCDKWPRGTEHICRGYGGSTIEDR